MAKPTTEDAMRNGLLVAGLALFASACDMAWAADDAAPDKVAPKDAVAAIELVIGVTGGEPPKPVQNASISLNRPDGSASDDPRRTDSKGEARFRKLAKGEVTIVVVAKDWKTFKVTRTLDKPRETVDVLLVPLD
jgi:hypothetical protein